MNSVCKWRLRCAELRLLGESGAVPSEESLPKRLPFLLQSRVPSPCSTLAHNSALTGYSPQLVRAAWGRFTAPAIIGWRHSRNLIEGCVQKDFLRIMSGELSFGETR
jgi:hypothetical protein